MRQRAATMLARAPEHLAEGRGAAEIRAQDQGIDERPDQFLCLCARSLGRRKSHGDIVLIGITLQQDIEGRHERHEQRRAFGAADLGQTPDDCFRNRQGQPRAAKAPARRPRSIGRQMDPRQTVLQALYPVSELRFQPRSIDPFPLPRGIIAILDRKLGELRRAAGNMRPVAKFDLAKKKLHRPAVAGDLVKYQQQHMFALAELEQAHPQRWIAP